MQLDLAPHYGASGDSSHSARPLPGFLTAQSFLGRSKVLEYHGCRDAPEGRRELVHRIAELASLFSKVLSNFCCNLAISHLVNCFDTDDASTQAFIRETLFELSLCLTGTK